MRAKMDFKDLYPGGFDAKQFSQLESAEPPEQAFLTELQNYGLIVSRIEATDKPVRCDMQDEKRGKKSGWYMYYPPDPNIAGGAYGDWRKGSSISWSSLSQDQMSPAEHAAFRARMQEIRRQNEIDRVAVQDEAAKRVQAIITKLPYAATHPYLERKKINPFGILYEDEKKALVVPMRNISGEIRSFQRIFGNGDKRFYGGGEVKGNFYLLGSAFTEPTYIVEGFATGATVHEVTGKAVVVAFNAGNIKDVVQAIREAENPHQLIIAADNDRKTDGNPGLRFAHEAAEGQFGVSVVYPEFKGTEGSDFNDLLHEQGLDAVKSALVPHSNTSRGFEITPISQLSEPEPIRWLIHDFMVSDTLSCIFGPSGSGKSFLALDMGLHIAAGLDWHTRPVQQGAVIYICGEGRRGVITRINAWLKHHNQPNTIPFYVSKGPLLLLEPDSVSQLIDTIHQSVMAAGHDVALIIVDTLNRNFGEGDENSTKDMTMFINRLTDARIKSGAAINIVHHTGLQDTHRARGNSALRAALDTELSVIPFEHGFSLKTTKQKDAEEHDPIGFKHLPIELSEDVTSIVLQPDKDPAVIKDLTRKVAKEGTEKRIYRKVINQLIEQHRMNNPNETKFFSELQTVNKLLISAGIGERNTSRMHKWAAKEGLAKNLDSRRMEIFVSD